MELTSDEQESVEIWNDSLSALGALGMVAPPADLDSAVHHLQSLLSADGPQRGDWFSPIQVLDSSEASGLEFDAAFITGLADDMWPPASRALPLIPHKLQQASDVPGSTPEKLQTERRSLTNALFASAPVVQASYHGRLSPLAARLTGHETHSPAFLE